jgi:hypothetical protein
MGQVTLINVNFGHMFINWSKSSNTW